MFGLFGGHHRVVDWKLLKRNC